MKATLPGAAVVGLLAASAACASSQGWRTDGTGGLEYNSPIAADGKILWQKSNTCFDMMSERG